MTNYGSHLFLIYIFMEKIEVGTCLFSHVCATGMFTQNLKTSKALF